MLYVERDFIERYSIPHIGPRARCCFRLPLISTTLQQRWQKKQWPRRICSQDQRHDSHRNSIFYHDCCRSGCLDVGGAIHLISTIVQKACEFLFLCLKFLIYSQLGSVVAIPALQHPSWQHKSFGCNIRTCTNRYALTWDLYYDANEVQIEGNMVSGHLASKPTASTRNCGPDMQLTGHVGQCEYQPLIASAKPADGLRERFIRRKQKRHV